MTRSVMVDEQSLVGKPVGAYLTIESILHRLETILRIIDGTLVLIIGILGRHVLSWQYVMW